MRRWWRERRAREAEQQAYVHDLVDDHARRVAEGDPDAIEADRDNLLVDGVPARAQVGLTLYLLLLVVTVVPLVGLFWLIQQWVG